MELTTPTLATLFDQLGLASDQASIDEFAAKHSPLPDGVKLSEAEFWTPQQANFLRQQLLQDAEWATVVDDLNRLLSPAQ